MARLWFISSGFTVNQAGVRLVKLINCFSTYKFAVQFWSSFGTLYPFLKKTHLSSLIDLAAASDPLVTSLTSSVAIDVWHRALTSHTTPAEVMKAQWEENSPQPGVCVNNVFNLAVCDNLTNR